MTLSVRYESFEQVTKLLDKLSAKASKYECEFSYSIGEPYFKKTVLRTIDHITQTIHTHPDKFFVTEAVDITVSDTLINANGWTVSAHIEHLSDSCNVVTPIGYSGELPKSWFSLKGSCEHCNTNRNRTKTYIVCKDGEYKQVGAGCLHDYTGIRPVLAITFAQVNDYLVEDDLDASSFSSMYKSSKQPYTVVEVVAHAMLQIASNGYVKSELRNSTRESVLKALNSNVEIPKQLLEEARKVCEEISMISLDDASTFIIQSQNLVANEYCSYRHIGRLCYLPEALKHHKEYQLKQAQKARTAYYNGEVGERICVNVISAHHITSFETQYGVTHIYKFLGNNNTCFVWFSSVWVEDLEAVKQIKGTIKEFNEYNGELQTVLTRCKVII